MKLQYRDRWPTPEEVRAHNKPYHGDIYRCMWLVREWHNEHWTSPNIEHLTEMDGQVYFSFGSERHDHASRPVTEYSGVFSVAPIDYDGNAVEWPEVTK